MTDLISLPDAEKLTRDELEERIRQLAITKMELSTLSKEQMNVLSNAVLFDQLKAELSRKVSAARINWEEEKDAFLSDCKSAHTKRAYKSGINKLSSWLVRQNLSHSDLTPRLADNFIRDMRSAGGDADSVRIDISACSAFYSFLERRYDEIRNPFRGTRARPRSTWKTASIPSPEEVEIIYRQASPLMLVAIICMYEMGLRIGALPYLEIRDNGFYRTTSKGKTFTGVDKIPDYLPKLIEKAGLDKHTPFSNLTMLRRDDAVSTNPETWLRVNFYRLTSKLKDQRLIRNAYSCHDLRHAFAERNKDRGLLWLQDRLQHSSVGITERYVRNKLG